VIKKYGSEIYIMEADSLIALFQDVQAAYHAVMEVNAMIKQIKLILTCDVPFRICAGIGYGDLLVTGDYGEFFGSENKHGAQTGQR